MDEASNGHPAARCCSGFFALVDYLPDPLGGYLDRLRGDLVAGCRLQSHVTVLPPRELCAPESTLVDTLERWLEPVEPFEIMLGDVEVFESTNVIYLDLSAGRERVEQLHRRLSQDVFHYQEPFEFHPHITLAQHLSGEDLPGKVRLARERWAQYAHSKRFVVDHLTFVRNETPDYWRTVSEHPLAEATLLKTV